jgi:hypothetical protein
MYFNMYSKAVLPHTTCPFKVTQNEALALGIQMMHCPEVKRRRGVETLGFHESPSYPKIRVKGYI